MTAQISLKEIERKAYRSTFEDGLVDITLGILILGVDYFGKNRKLPAGDIRPKLTIITAVSLLSDSIKYFCCNSLPN